MYRRINVTLPEATLQLLNQVAPKGDRSRFIQEAIQHYIAQIQKETLRQQLMEGAIQRADRDLNLTEEWSPLEEEAWQQSAN